MLLRQSVHASPRPVSNFHPVVSTARSQEIRSSRPAGTESTVIYDNRRNPPKVYLRGKFLGKGGFAKCYEVVDNDSKQVYAVKVISKESISKSRARAKLASEIAIHKTLDQERIVKFHSYFEDLENHYMVLELCPNHSLNELLRKKKRLNDSEASYYVRSLVEGLAYLKKNKVIHRDLKLGNLFLGVNMELKMGDFGLAARLDFDQQKRMTVCGTPNYIAPEILEQQSKSSISHTTPTPTATLVMTSREAGHSFPVDVWSTGVILYTLVVGIPPFEDKDVKATYQRIRENKFSFPDSVYVSSDCKSLIRWMLRPDPRQRPSLEEILRHPYLEKVSVIPSSLSCLCVMTSGGHHHPPLLTPRAQLVSGGGTPCGGVASQDNQNYARFLSPCMSSQQNVINKRPVAINTITSSLAGLLLPPPIPHHNQNAVPHNQGGTTTTTNNNNIRPPLVILNNVVQSSSSSQRVAHQIGVMKSVNGFAPPQSSSCDVTDETTAQSHHHLHHHSSTNSSSNINNVNVVGLSITESLNRKFLGNSPRPLPPTSLALRQPKEEFTSSRRTSSSHQIIGRGGVLVGVQGGSLPRMWISRWLDYSSKYGVAYELSDASSTLGVYFNDATRMVANESRARLLYISRDRTSRAEVVQTYSDDPEDHSPGDLKKKVILMRNFRLYFCNREEKEGTSRGRSYFRDEQRVFQSQGFQRATLDDIPVHVRKWLKTPSGIIFQFVDRSCHIFFTDGYEALICSKGSMCSLLEPKRDSCHKTYMLEYTQDVIEDAIFRKLSSAKCLLAELSGNAIQQPDASGNHNRRS